MDNTIFVNIYKNIQMLWYPILIITLVMGITMMAVGLIRCADPQERKTAKYFLLTGFLFCNVINVINIISYSVFGSNFQGEFGFDVSGFEVTRITAQEEIKRILVTVFAMVKLLGLLAFIKGMHILSRIGSAHDASFLGAAVFVFGGVFLLNFEYFLQELGGTFGGNLQNIIQDFIK